MKQGIQFALGILFIVFIYTGVKNSIQAVPEYNQAAPRMRVSRSASLTLSTSFQRLDFTGASTYNVNTFGIDPTSGNPMVYWDATNKLFRFYNGMDQNLMLTFFGQTTASLLSINANLRLRFVVPNGVSSGVNLTFPFPDGPGYTDVWPVTMTNTTARTYVLPIYISAPIRNNGFYVEAALSNALAIGTAVTLDQCAVGIQANNPLN